MRNAFTAFVALCSLVLLPAASEVPCGASDASGVGAVAAQTGEGEAAAQPICPPAQDQQPRPTNMALPAAGAMLGVLLSLGGGSATSTVSTR